MSVGVYVAYDSKRDRFELQFRASSDEAAKREFCSFFREFIRPSRWEKRKLGRFSLFKLGHQEGPNDPVVKLPKPVCLMLDEDVRMDWQWFWMAEPPASEEDDKWLAAEYARLDALDAERIARRGNQGL